MNLKEIFVADLKATLEETASIMADRVILESLAKNGSVSLEEAEFYDSLVRRVITEGAEEFVPESLDLSYLQEMADMEAAEAEAAENGAFANEGDPMAGDIMILTDEEGATYQYNPVTGELTPVQQNAEEGQEGLEDLESDEGNIGEGVPNEKPFAESTEVKAEAKVIEESEVSPSEVEETKVEGGVETDETVEAEPTEEKLDESTEVEAEVQELTESQLIVSNLIKSLGA